MAKKNKLDKLVVYANENCKYCKILKDKLDSEKIKYTNIDTIKNEDKWRQVVDKTFIATVPTVLYKDTFFVAGRDFANAESLVKLINDFKGLDATDPRLVLERIRTLTYSMTMAFGRMDNILRNIESKLNIKENEYKSTN